MRVSCKPSVAKPKMKETRDGKNETSPLISVISNKVYRARTLESKLGLRLSFAVSAFESPG